MVKKFPGRREFHGHEPGGETHRTEKRVEQQNVIITVPVCPAPLQNFRQHDVGCGGIFEAERVRHVAHPLFYEIRQIGRDRADIVVSLGFAEPDRAAPDERKLRVVIADDRQLGKNLFYRITQLDDFNLGRRRGRRGLVREVLTR